MWWTHCGDAAVYKGMPSGLAQLESEHGPQALEYFRAHVRRNFGDYAADPEELLKACGKDRDTTAYVFQCRKCGAFGGYIDSN
jgi:uncharacterized protein CbrC (UPF0167 family)